MKQVQHHIEESQHRLAQHQFFLKVRNDEPPAHVLAALRAGTFWVMAFQDALRINTSLITDPAFKRIARHHLAEDSGHDRWFLDDVRLLIGRIPDAVELFSEDHRPTRELTYQLLAESSKAEEDIERILLIMVFESTGQVFFPEMVAYFKRTGIEPSLQYFAQKHLDVEKSHEIVEQKMLEMLTSIELSESVRRRCIATVDRCYAAFTRLFDFATEAMANPLEDNNVAFLQARSF